MPHVLTPTRARPRPRHQVLLPLYPADRPLRWRGALVGLGAGVGAYGIMRLLSLMPGVAEAVYGAGLGPTLVQGVSLVTGVVPFNVAEWLLLGYAGWLGYVGAGALREAVGRRRRWRNALGAGVRRLARDAGVLLALFYVLWGWNYARSPFPERAGWPSLDGVEVEEVAALARAATEAVNEAYLALHGTPDAGSPTVLPENPRVLEQAIDEGWARAAELLGLPASASAAYGRVKWPIFSGGLARLGINGIYVPFTGEANVVRELPAVRVPVSMAHEKAHQRGYTGEADANFLGFVAAALAPDPLSRYSAAFFAHNQLVNELRFHDRETRDSLLESRLAGVSRDVEELRAYHRRYAGPARDVGSGINNRFLVAHGIAGGVQDYGRSVWQVLMYARLNDGEVVPTWPARME